MNKIIYAFTWLFVSFFGLNAFAQELKMEIYDANDKLIENGTNLASLANTSSVKLLHTDSLFIKNISESTINIKIRRIDDHAADGSFSVFKALAQNMSADETLTPNYWTLNSGATLPQEAYFLGSYYPQSVIGTSTVIYSFLSVDENDKVLDSVYVRYAFSNTSITPMSQDGEFLYYKEVYLDCDPTEVCEYPINLHNHTTSTVGIRIGKTIQEVEEGQSVYFRFGGTEYAADVNFSDANGVNIAADQTLEGANGFVALFNANGIDGNQILTKVRYKIFNKAAGNDADYVTLVYNPSGVGFSELDAYQISKAYPNPATDYFTIDHDFNHHQNAVLKVYALNGNLMAVYPIMKNSKRMKVSVQDFAAGAYFLSIEVNDQPIGVEKLIVK